jgi:SAF domain
MTVTDHDEHGAAAVPERPPRPLRARRGRPTDPAPAARFEPGRVAEARHRNPTWIIAGVLLVLLSALGGVVLFTSSDDKTDVLVAANDLDPGDAVERSDLRIQRVAVDAGVSSIPVAAAEGVVGQHPIGRIPAGTMLSAAMFEPAVPLGPDEVVVGAALDPGEAPLFELAVGDAVELVEVEVPAPGTDTASAGGAAAPAPRVQSIGTGTVWAVEPVATGQLWVSVRADRQVGLAASLASAADRLRVALIGGTG